MVKRKKNAAVVALEAGNSPQMIFKHYRELVTEKEADAWFSIVPGGAGRKGRSAKGKPGEVGGPVEY